MAARISEAELEVMKILWREDGPVSFTDIRIELQNITKWKKSTINTLIRRLADKKMITAEKKNIAHYTANISQHEYTQAEEQALIDKLYDGSAKRFVAALCQNGKLSEKDIDELKEYFKLGDSSDVSFMG